ncbi:LysR substrate-binding domain-containing protein [Marinobacterium jannaschii]|uniref:LysR substrate-binding domain-containing protein n=1 Tax=Marinobacterium jannaschii TaxID=64970 RepID=UPI0004815C28|nr:LysR substrate-binding domain-containing protein [Marinobacterium jannaschii]
MKSIRHRLPPLNSLLVFEAAARTLNFTRAAEELHVSQAAVSKQIRYLEDHLEVELFERHGRRVQLSGRGEQLYRKVSASLNYLADAVDELQPVASIPTVTVSANTAMSHYWLSVAINGFHRAHRDSRVNIRVITSDVTRDLFHEDVDIAIAYEPGRRIGWQMTPLFAEELFPVASPDYLQRCPFRGDGPAELMQHTLLDFDRIEPNWINWKLWFEALAVDSRQLVLGSRFNNYIVLVDAAERGQGITLGARFLIDQKMCDGVLQRVSDFSVVSGRSYWVALNESRQLPDEVRLIYDWLAAWQSS